MPHKLKLDLSCPVVAIILYCCVTFKLQATKVFYISGIQICSLEKSDFPRDVYAVSEGETRCAVSLILFISRYRGGLLQ